MGNKIIMVVISCLFCVTAGATNNMVAPTFYMGFEGTSSWNLGAGDYSWSPAIENQLVVSTLGTPTHGTGFIGNGQVGGGAKYASYDYSISGREASSIIDVTSFTVGAWVKLDLVGQGVQQMLKLQGSYTNEYVQIDYSAAHPDQARIMWGGGQAGDPTYAWETAKMSVMSASPWVYVAASYVEGNGVSADAVVPYIFDATGALISGGSSLVGGSWITAPSIPLCADKQFRLNAGILVGRNHATANVAPLGVDEVNIQGYLTQSQIQSQVNKMILGEALTVVPEPISLVLLGVGGLLIRKRR